MGAPNKVLPDAISPATGGHGATILRSTRHNQGPGFSEEERRRMGLEGLLPARVESVGEQASRTLGQLAKRPSNMEKFLFLNSVKQSNVQLFYRLLIDHIKDLAPIVYTPTVGDVCMQYSHNFIHPEGLYINKYHKGRVSEVLRNWPEEEVDIIVVTDGSRILGLGDLGVNGMGISVGKLALYVTCAGFDPRKTLPIVIDVGTNTSSLLADPAYLGLREPRMDSSSYTDFMDEFMSAVRQRWPKVLVQFEDFATPYCFDFLERYRRQYLCFNDDIQGTGAVILSGFMNASKVLGLPLKEHRLVFFGAGSAATGVADEIVKFFVKEGGMGEDEARAHFWLVDSKGLVTSDRGDELASHKLPYARRDNAGRQLNDLLATVRHVRPTALIGLAVQPGAFTKEVVEEMSRISPRPIIFPLSNPTSKAECTFKEALEWSRGTVIFAAGSPFDPAEWNGRTHVPGQGNNMYIFPGLGLGAVLSGAREVTDEMTYAASRALAGCVSEAQLASGLLYPPLSDIRFISAKIAVEVILAACKQGVSTKSELASASHQELWKLVNEAMFDPHF